MLRKGLSADRGRKKIAQDGAERGGGEVQLLGFMMERDI